MKENIKMFLYVIGLSFSLLSCSNNSINKTEITLKQFINNGSRFRCEKLEVVKKYALVSVLNRKEDLLKQALRDIQKNTDADYYTYQAGGGELVNTSVEVQPYKCNFKDASLEKGADEVALFSSDHIVVNCKQIDKIKTNYYHDDYENIYNHYRNIGLSKNANVANLEETISGKFSLGLYQCSDKSLAKSRIDIRKELREKKAINLKEIQNRMYSNYQEAMNSTLRILIYRINRSNVY